MKKLLLLCFLIASFGAQAEEGFQSNCKIIDVAGDKLEGIQVDCDKKRVGVEFFYVYPNADEAVILNGDLYGGDSLEVQFDDYYWSRIHKFEYAETKPDTCNADGYHASVKRSYISSSSSYRKTEHDMILQEDPDALFINYLADAQGYFMNPKYKKSGSVYEILKIGDAFSEVGGCISYSGGSFRYSKNLKGVHIKKLKTMRSESMKGVTLTDPALAGLQVVLINNESPQQEH